MVVMFYSQKAYLNASGKVGIYTLMHDVKRSLADSKIPAGLVTILSSQATTSVILLENEDDIKQALITHVQAQFDSAVTAKPSTTPRRSGSGPAAAHTMAALTGLTLTLPFVNGRLLTHLQHEVFALDYEPKSGRREFVITVMAAPTPPAPAGAPPPGRR